MTMEQPDLESLLGQWEETYKKGLLSFWLLLLLAQRKAYPYEIRSAIYEISHNTIDADENSIYRALYRLADAGIVESEVVPSETGRSRRYFFLTELGRELIHRFITRNILIFEQPDVAELIQKTLSLNGDQKG
jgi:DNA-binding PadR family transcriptional regulator